MAAEQTNWQSTAAEQISWRSSFQMAEEVLANRLPSLYAIL
jgi:hypothetical protein